MRRHKNTAHNYSEAEQHHLLQPTANHGQQLSSPKKKKRVFMWFFLIINLLFLIWVIAGIKSGADGSAQCASQVTEFFTKEDCEAANGLGATFGVGLIVAFWLAVDFILVLIWAVTKLARR